MTTYYSCYVFALVISALLLIDLCPKRRGLHIDIVSISFLACNDRFICSINDKNQSGNNLCNFRCHFDEGGGGDMDMDVPKYNLLGNSLHND